MSFTDYELVNPGTIIRKEFLYNWGELDEKSPHLTSAFDEKEIGKRATKGRWYRKTATKNS